MPKCRTGPNVRRELNRAPAGPQDRAPDGALRVSAAGDGAGNAFAPGGPARHRTRPGAAFAAVAVLCAALLAGCRSALEYGPGPAARPSGFSLPRTGAWRAVAQAVVRARGRDVEAVVYLARSDDGGLRATFESSSGLTLLDARSDPAAGGAWVPASPAGSGSASPSPVGEAFAALALGDVSRMIGAHSVFAADPASAVPVLGEPAGRFAFVVAEGWRVVLTPGDLATTTTEFDVLLADRAGRPRARIRYEDAGPEGLPRTITLTDVRDGHTTDVEIAQVLPPVPADARPAPGAAR